MSVSIPVERLLESGVTNLRASVRYRCGPALPGKIYLSNDVTYKRAWVRDLSLTGIGMLMDAPIDTGTRILIQVRSDESGVKYDLPALVKHTTAHLGEWIIGCEFVNALEDDTLDDLL
jgi:hypothetical protein